MEALLFQVVNDDVCVETFVKNAITMACPEMLGHAHDNTTRLLHVVNHVLRQCVTHISIDLAIQGVEQFEKGLDQRRHLLLVSLIITQKHNLLLEKHTTQNFDQVINLNQFEQLPEAEVAIKEYIRVGQKDLVDLEQGLIGLFLLYWVLPRHSTVCVFLGQTENVQHVK